MDRERALALIYRTVDIVNQQLPADRRLARRPDTVIVGAGGALDSLGIVNFIVALEEHVRDAQGRSVDLLDFDLIAAERSPFHTIDTLTAHLMALP